MEYIQEEFLDPLQFEIRNFNVPYLKLNPKTKMIAFICFLLILLTFLFKLTKITFILIKGYIQQLPQWYNNRQIDEINKMFEEKVNIKAEQIDDFLGFLGKNKGKSQKEQIEQMQTFKKPQTLTEAQFQYKPKNFQLLEKIKRETAEKEKQNNPFFVNRYNKNDYNNMNDYGNYLSSQTMQNPNGQQQFITPDEFPSFSYKHSNDILPHYEFGKSQFNKFGDLHNINKRSGNSFGNMFDSQNIEQQRPFINFTQQQKEIFDKVSRNVINGIPEEKGDMELEENMYQQQINNQKHSNMNIQHTQSNQNQEENVEIEDKNKDQTKQTKKRSNQIKEVGKKKTIAKETKNKLKPTKSNLTSNSEEKQIKRLKKRGSSNKDNQQNIKGKSLKYNQDYSEEENNEEDEDEQFIIYKKQKKSQSIPSQKSKLIKQRFNQEQSIKAPIRKQNKQIQSQEQPQRTEIIEQQIQQQNQIQQNNLNNNNKIQLQQSKQVSESVQQPQQEQVEKQQKENSQEVIINQQENNVYTKSGSTDNNSILPLPANKKSGIKWNYNQNNINKQQFDTNQDINKLPFFNVDQFGHQNIQVTQKLDFDIYDEKNQKGYKAFLINNQNAFLMPLNSPEKNNSDDSEEKKENNNTNNNKNNNNSENVENDS